MDPLAWSVFLVSEKMDKNRLLRGDRFVFVFNFVQMGEETVLREGEIRLTSLLIPLVDLFFSVF